MSQDNLRDMSQTGARSEMKQKGGCCHMDAVEPEAPGDRANTAKQCNQNTAF